MATSNIPLCVDLDGTLIQTDLLMESAIKLLYKNPLNLFRFVVWASKGKAHIKRQIAKRIHIDAACLPYNIEFLDWMRKTTKDRDLVLCTASDQSLADAVAAHVGGFQLVLGSDGIRNFSGITKSTLNPQFVGVNNYETYFNKGKWHLLRYCQSHRHECLHKQNLFPHRLGVKRMSYILRSYFQLQPP